MELSEVVEEAEAEYLNSLAHPRVASLEKINFDHLMQELDVQPEDVAKIVDHVELD